MKYAVVFSLLGVVCAFYAVTASALAARLLSGWFAVAFVGVGLAYGGVGPRAFLKNETGRLNPFSYVLYGPYHLLNTLSLAGFRRDGRENPFDQVAENVYLGCRLSRGDGPAIAALGIASVLDLTCEFGEVRALRERSYLCIPVLDTRPPTLEQLTTGAEWIRQEAAKGPVYVHCALGHGRSALFVAAFLMLAGEARTASEAIAQIKAQRPNIGLHPEQVALLEKVAAR